MKKKELPELLRDLYLKDPTNTDKLINIGNQIIDSSFNIIYNIEENNKNLAELNSNILESNKELSTSLKQNINRLKDYDDNLVEISIKYEIYYPIINKIKLNKNYSDEEKNAIIKLGFPNKKIDTWDFAFCILAYRNRNNPHFLQLFNDQEEDPLDLSNINSLMLYALKFNNQRNKYSSRMNKNKKNKEKI